MRVTGKNEAQLVVARMLTVLVKNLEILLAQRREEERRAEKRTIYCPLARTIVGFENSFCQEGSESPYRFKQRFDVPQGATGKSGRRDALQKAQVFLTNITKSPSRRFVEWRLQVLLIGRDDRICAAELTRRRALYTDDFAFIDSMRWLNRGRNARAGKVGAE